MLKGPIILLVVARHDPAAGDHRAPRRLAAAAAAGLGRAADAGGGIAVVHRDRRSPARASSSRRVGHSLLGKVATGQQSHGAPPGYYLAAFPLTFWPGSLFAALAAPFVWARRREPAVRFCLCWIAPTWIVFELVATKLPHYVLPTYPAIACLAAAGLLAPTRSAGRDGRVYLMRAFAASGCSSASRWRACCRSRPGCWKRASIRSAC